MKPVLRRGCFPVHSATEANPGRRLFMTSSFLLHVHRKLEGRLSCSGKCTVHSSNRVVGWVCMLAPGCSQDPVHRAQQERTVDGFWLTPS